MLKKPTPTPPRHDPKVVKALRNFAVSITVFNIFGYTVLGFEQPWSWPFIALAAAYTLEIGLEWLSARLDGRLPRFQGRGIRGLIEFLYPAHITAIAVNMLIYVNNQVGVMIFGVFVAIGAKWILRAPVRGRLRHFMNPSNLGITVILLLFPWAAIAQPYEFTEHTAGVVDWVIPVAIFAAGTVLNAQLTGRMWLIGSWLIFFILQAVLRGLLFDTSIVGALAPITGVAFVLFTNYMIPDPGTTPSRPAEQVAFGAGVALFYGFFAGVGIAYGLFFATAAVCALRGAYLWALHLSKVGEEQSRSHDQLVNGAAPGIVKPVGEKVVSA